MTDWKFPEEVSGWLSYAEGYKLGELARGKRVLEIGCYKGRSTICLAQTAKSVDCIDPCDGRATDAPASREEILERLSSNLFRYGVTDKIRILVGTTEDIAPDLDHASYDLIFIDGDHSRAAVEKDIGHAKRLLAEGGIIAFHDYREDELSSTDGYFDPGVTEMVNKLLQAGSLVEARADSLIALKLKPLPHEKPLVFLSMPRAGRWSTFGACRGFQLWPTAGRCQVAIADTMSSGLDRNFNRCLAGALNARKTGATHWALLHEDVAPDNAWVDILLAEMLRADADVISAVIPIKSEEGLSSTAVDTSDPWMPRRLTMAEIFDLPTTFTDADVGGRLLLNTGLWLCDLRRPWVQSLDTDSVESLPCFNTLSRMIRTPDGEFISQNRSEDWEWSRELRRRGAVQVATRAVGLEHVGEMEFTNRKAWGTWKTDEVFAKNLAKPGREAEECTPTTMASVS